MRYLSAVLMLSLFCFACSETEDSVTKDAEGKTQSATSTKPFVSNEDLPAIQERGRIRFVAPQFDGAEALPRDGLPVLDYQALAQEFANEFGLNPEWVYVKGFSELETALNEGAADVIVTNLTVTEKRRKKMAFSRSIAQVSEMVVTNKAAKITNIDALSGFNVAAPEGSSYLETLRAIDNPDFNIIALPSGTSDIELLDGLKDQDYDATLMDSDVARRLLPAYPSFEQAFIINRNRSIAWAVRKENPKLLTALNKFLVSHHVREAANKNARHDWEQIVQHGRIRMLTLNNPASYFMWRGELMGFDYDLLKKFAEDNNLHLAVVIKDSIPELLESLKEGEGDVVAASITYSSDREKDGISFTDPYLKVNEQIVGRDDNQRIESLSDLSGSSVGVNPDTVFFKKLSTIAQTVDNIKLIEESGASTEELITRMSEGKYDFTVADSHLVALEQTYHQNIAAKFDLEKDVPIAWALRDDQEQLKEKLNSFIKTHYRGLFYNVTYKKYFENERRIRKYQEGRILSGDKLSPYDDIVKKYADQYGMDWRLIVAQMYQESKFDPNAKSFAGALGLMQVLPRTGKEFGLTKLQDPEVAIKAGIQYMNWLEDRFPGELDVQERIFFTLAAYNAGTGHVRDARKLARQLGYDANRWFGNVEKAMLKLAKREYYQKARFGYVRGSEPVEYVRKIHDRYLSYLNAN